MLPFKSTLKNEYGKGQKISKTIFLETSLPENERNIRQILYCEARAKFVKYIFLYLGNAVSTKNVFEIH